MVVIYAYEEQAVIKAYLLTFFSGSYIILGGRGRVGWKDVLV